MIAWLLVACQLQPMPPDQPCKEAGYAIASRTLTCTGDEELANARYEHFEANTTCIEVDLDREPANVHDPIEPDFFHCAWAIEQMSCEEVEDCGEELDCYLGRSEACA